MEHELRKNIRGILLKMSNRKTTIWKKLGEIILEIGIIIFAVSFAVAMERKKEHRHEQKEAKEFLTGLRHDLANDINEMEDDKKSYLFQSKWFTYLGKSKQLDRDSVKKYEWVIWGTTHLLINNGRYEGFKASGKMNTIENIELRNHILDLYQETLVGLTNATAAYIELKRKFNTLIYKNRRMEGEPGDNLAEILLEPETRSYCLRLRFTSTQVNRYDSAIARSKKIIELINKEYH